MAQHNLKHGHARKGKLSPEYQAYHDAKRRCENPNCASWKYYGERGIKFLFSSFKQFLSELGRKPSKRHVLDRIDPNGDYMPGNCRWTTTTISRINQRKRKCTSSKFRGVCWHKLSHKWMAKICLNRSYRYLGLFTSETEAALAFDAASSAFRGEHAMLNFPKREAA